MEKEGKKPKKGKMTPGGNLAPEKEIVEKNPGNFNSRYKGDLAPEKEIVEDYKKPSYDSRYN